MIEVVSTETGAGTIGMLVEATPTAARAAVCTPQNIVNTLFPQQIESFRACGQGLRVDFDASDSDEDIGDEKCYISGPCTRLRRLTVSLPVMVYSMDLKNSDLYEGH